MSSVLLLPKEVKDETVRMAGGRLFHARDAATGKAQSTGHRQSNRSRTEIESQSSSRCKHRLLVFVTPPTCGSVINVNSSGIQFNIYE